MALIKSLALSLLLFIVPLVCHAVVPAWQIIPNESSLNFSGTMNDARIIGKFESFNGDIRFDPNQLSQSHVKITVFTNSLVVSYSEVANTLKTMDWLGVKMFSSAVFEASQFKKINDKTFDAMGKLTIRDVTLPLTVKFTQEEYSGNRVKIKGFTTIKRTAFKIGQGEWASTEDVKDEVDITFVIAAIKK